MFCLVKFLTRAHNILNILHWKYLAVAQNILNILRCKILLRAYKTLNILRCRISRPHRTRNVLNFTRNYCYFKLLKKLKKYSTKRCKMLLFKTFTRENIKCFGRARRKFYRVKYEVFFARARAKTFAVQNYNFWSASAARAQKITK